MSRCALVGHACIELLAATTAFYVCISRGSKDMLKALDKDVPSHEMQHDPAMTLYDILSGMRSGTLLSEIERRFHRDVYVLMQVRTCWIYNPLDSPLDSGSMDL